eukprot:m.30665 g.30665  ORF g.30665 m.30665 type:complete len:485 (-) comp16326_c0_seq1:61-1515(-)
MFNRVKDKKPAGSLLRKTGSGRENGGDNKKQLLLCAVATFIFFIFMGTLMSFQEPRHFVIRQFRVLGQSSTLRKASFYLGGAKAEKSYILAKNYYETQKPLIEKSMMELKFHWYWSALSMQVSTIDLTWYDLIGKRMAMMAKLLKEDSRDDFKVEKDKCEMYRFFGRNNLPVVPVLGFWNSSESLLKEMHSGKAFDNVKSWPIWVKACHLTQGSSHGIRMLKSREYIEENWEELETWIAEKWVYRADDWERPWREDGNLITSTLTPGWMLQASAELTYNPETKEKQIVELKTEVLWGRPYLAISPDIPGYPGALFTRSGNEGSMMVFDGTMAQSFMAGEELPKKSWWNWIIDEKHLDCVWPLAERAALLMTIDCVRIDIFITKGKPTECVINEDSISSGMAYGPHFEFLTYLWAGPHVNGGFKVFNSTLPVYMQTAQTIPGLPAIMKSRGHPKHHDLVAEVIHNHTERNVSKEIRTHHNISKRK